MSNGRYEMYPLLMDELERNVAKSAVHGRGKKLAKHERDHVSALRFLYRQSPELLYTLDTTILCDEFNWLYKSERNVIFPSGPEILTRLLDAKVDLSNPAPIRMPHESFILAVPKGFTYKGIAIPPVMVAWCDTERTQVIVNQFTGVVVGCGDIKVQNWYTDDVGLFITYRGRSDNETSGLSFRANLATKDLPDVLRCEDAAHYQKEFGSFSYKFLHSSDLTPEEGEVQFLVVRLIAMLGMYSHAYPASLKSGYPGNEPKFMEPRLHSKWSKSTISMPSAEVHGANTKAYHYRSWHFRQLLDKRFYKGEHAQKPIGSRVVFVRDSMVGRQVEAETLDEQGGI